MANNSFHAMYMVRLVKWMTCACAERHNDLGLECRPSSGRRFLRLKQRMTLCAPRFVLVESKCVPKYLR